MSDIAHATLSSRQLGCAAWFRIFLTSSDHKFCEVFFRKKTHEESPAMPNLHSDHGPTASAATPRPLVLTGLAVWAIASGGGFLWLLSSSATPGPTRVPEPTWPQDSRIVPDSARANLVLLVHPHCPCSQASIAELSEIMACCNGLVAAHVLFLKPSQMPDGWEVTDLWHRAASIPGACPR